MEMAMDMSQEPFYARILREDAAPQDRDNRFARAMSQEPFMRDAAPQDRDNRFMPAGAVEMHLDISQEPFYAKI